MSAHSAVLQQGNKSAYIFIIRYKIESYSNRFAINDISVLQQAYVV